MLDILVHDLHAPSFLIQRDRQMILLREVDLRKRHAELLAVAEEHDTAMSRIHDHLDLAANAVLELAVQLSVFIVADQQRRRIWQRTPRVVLVRVVHVKHVVV